MDHELPQQLQSRLKQPLPGRAAYRPLEPELSYGRHAGPPAHDARRAAVLLVLYRHEGQWHLPLTLRPTELAKHGGQISLPGGLIERGESSGEAALRELEEELGTRAGIELIGRLSELYVYVTNFRVTPWVAVAAHRPTWIPNPQEVAEVLEVPLAHLVDRAQIGEFLITRQEFSFQAPYFAWQHHKIWGATSMILAELAEVVRELEL